MLSKLIRRKYSVAWYGGALMVVISAIQKVEVGGLWPEVASENPGKNQETPI
jgi:hypothetical protein